MLGLLAVWAVLAVRRREKADRIKPIETRTRPKSRCLERRARRSCPDAALGFSTVVNLGDRYFCGLSHARRRRALLGVYGLVRHDAAWRMAASFSYPSFSFGGDREPARQSRMRRGMILRCRRRGPRRGRHVFFATRLRVRCGRKLSSGSGCADDRWPSVTSHRRHSPAISKPTRKSGPDDDDGLRRRGRREPRRQFPRYHFGALGAALAT